MRNEIVARHGYVFITPEMQSYFENQSWYKPIYDNNRVVKSLSEIEKQNMGFIKSRE